MEFPWRITLDTNPDDCNLHCLMCEQHSKYALKYQGKPRRMSLEMLQTILEQAKVLGVKEIIPSTMGEPLLFKHFEFLLESCKKSDFRLNLTTNGTFPKHGPVLWAEKLLPVCSDIKISVNGISTQIQEAIMQGSKAEKTWSNITQFVSARNCSASEDQTRCTITLQLTFLQMNMEELVPVLKKAIELGINRIKGHHLWTHFEEIKTLSMRRSSESIRQWNEVVGQMNRIAEQKRLKNGSRITLTNFHYLNPDHPEELLENSRCPFLGKELWINHEGKYSPCCAPDNLRRQLGDFGNLQQKSIQNMWESKQYRTLVSDYQKQKLCQTCNMKVPK
ncbi:radical SAM protein [bacterium]|nr:radical SAM protein [bacterium]